MLRTQTQQPSNTQQQLHPMNNPTETQDIPNNEQTKNNIYPTTNTVPNTKQQHTEHRNMS
jgi:hypothetical protein